MGDHIANESSVVLFSITCSPTCTIDSNYSFEQRSGKLHRLAGGAAAHLIPVELCEISHLCVQTRVKRELLHLESTFQYKLQIVNCIEYFSLIYFSLSYQSCLKNPFFPFPFQVQLRAGRPSTPLIHLDRWRGWLWGTERKREERVF